MLAIAHVDYRYPRAPEAALKDVSLTARRGAVLGLLGPNGAGKSTLIALLAGLLTPDRGEVRIDGAPLGTARHQAPTRIAIAPQDHAFYPMLTVTQNLACFAGAARLGGQRRRQRIAACLAFAQLERHGHTRAEHLSGGLKRRLNLAIALLPEPELLLFDEPTVGVDPQSRAFILDAIQGLARAGAAVVYASHYMEEIEAIADRVVILDRGAVLEDGTLADLLARDTPVLTVAADGIDPAALSALMSRFGKASAHGARLRVVLDTPLAVALTALEAAGARIREVHYGRGNLEQLFMTLTQRSLRD